VHIGIELDKVEHNCTIVYTIYSISNWYDMRNDKAKAFKLRKQGKSYRMIQKELSVSRSTVSAWFKDIGWSNRIKKVLIEKNKLSQRKRMKKIAVIAGEERSKLYKEKREQAVGLYEQFKNDHLFVEGLMVYWGEGDNRLENGRIRVANSNPIMLRLFNQFLKKYFSEIYQRAKMYLILYPDLDEGKCKKYWSRMVGIPLDKFFKSQYIRGHSIHRRLEYGVGNIIISSRGDKEIIHTWLKLKQKEVELTRA